MWTFSPSAGITPDTDTITPPVSVRLFQKQTSGLPPEGVQLSLYMFAQWHNPAVYPFSSIHGPIQGHCVPFPVIPGWGLRHAYEQFRITNYSNSHMFFWTLGGSWCTRTEPIERPQFWSQDRLQQHASIFICISYFYSTKTDVRSFEKKKPFLLFELIACQ